MLNRYSNVSKSSRKSRSYCCRFSAMPIGSWAAVIAYYSCGVNSCGVNSCGVNSCRLNNCGVDMLLIDVILRCILRIRESNKKGMHTDVNKFYFFLENYKLEYILLYSYWLSDCYTNLDILYTIKCPNSYNNLTINKSEAKYNISICLTEYRKRRRRGKRKNWERERKRKRKRIEEKKRKGEMESQIRKVGIQI